MAIKYICDECEKEMDNREGDYLNQAFNRNDGECDIFVRMKCTSDSSKVLCKQCATAKVKAKMEEVALETYPGETEP